MARAPPVEERRIPFSKTGSDCTYIADFACYRRRLIVELDGGQHNLPENQLADERRTKSLRNRGFQVLRFWNIDVYEALEGVADRIRNGLGLPTLYSYDRDGDLATPTPSPSPQGGGD